MTIPRRIVFIAPFGLRKKTTVWARILPLAKNLRQCGHDIHILIPPWDSPDDAGVVDEQDGVALEHIAISGGPLLIAWRLTWRIRCLQPDIVHIVKPRAYAGVLQWILWYGRQLVAPGSLLCLDIDDWEQSWASITQHPWPVEPFLAWQEEWGIRHADAITAASTWLVNKAQIVSPHIPRHHLPNGVSLLPAGLENLGMDSDPSPSSTPRRILFFTRFIEVPPDWLARWWRSIRDQLPQAQLVVVGEALQHGREAPFRAAISESNQLQGRRSSLGAGIDGNLSVDWLGYVPPDRLAAMYATIDCAIFPAVPSDLQQAKCSVRLATTLLHGVPCVASRVGEQQYYGAAGAARLVNAEATPEEFAQAVIEVLTNLGERRQLSRLAQQHLLENYDWRKLSSGLEYFYDTVSQRTTRDDIAN